MQSSTFVLDDHLQANGTRWVTEIHTDAAGIEHRIVYLAPEGADYTAIMNARAAQMDSQLAEREFYDLVLTDGT